jgi:hypothetical protein
MNPLNSLILPDTDIFKEKLYPLFLFSTPLHYLQPVEPLADREPVETDLFMERGLCQAYTPAPLGNNRDRFMHLVNDIKNRKDDYAAQLSALTVAGLSRLKSEKKSEARSQIVSTLLKNHDVPAEEISDKEIEQWQARLVLTIAEILEREEEELRQDLFFLDDKELALFQELQGEVNGDEEGMIAELKKIRSNLQSPRPGEIKTRFQAWLKLMGSSPFPTADLWIASSQDGGDEIFNRYEKMASGVATPILKLALPGRIEVSPIHAVDQIEQFHRLAAEVHGAIIQDLAELRDKEIVIPAPVESLLPGQNDYVEHWNNLVDEHFPALSHSSAFLTFYILPDCSITKLLGLTNDKNDDHHARNGLMAILHS